MLNAVTDYLYAEAQKAATRDERDLWSVTLGIMAAVRRGSSDPFLDACHKVLGGSLEGYQSHRNKEKWLAKREWFAAMPDYDPMEAESVRLQKIDYRKQARPSGVDGPSVAPVISIRTRGDDADLEVGDLKPRARREAPKRHDTRASGERA